MDEEEINQNIRSAKELADEIVRSNLEGIQKRKKDMMLIRGTVLETAIDLEVVLDSIIHLYDESAVTYELSFQKKVNFVKNIIQEVDPSSGVIRADFTKDLDEIVKKRNVYAHCPQDYMKKELNVYDKKIGGYVNIKQDIQKTIELFNTVKKDLDNMFPFISKVILSKKKN